MSANFRGGLRAEGRSRYKPGRGNSDTDIDIITVNDFLGGTIKN